MFVDRHGPSASNVRVFRYVRVRGFDDVGVRARVRGRVCAVRVPVRMRVLPVP